MSKSQIGNNVILQQFEIKFSDKEDRNNLARLRDFLETKDTEYSKLRLDLDQIEKYYMIPLSTLSDSVLYKQYKKKLEEFIISKNHKDPYSQSEVNDEIAEICEVTYGVYIDSTRTHQKKYYVKNSLQNVQIWLKNITRKAELTLSLENIAKDKFEATKAIQNIYYVERGNQDYKKTISLYYAIIILVLIVISFLFLYKKSTKEIWNHFLNGNGLQFIALFAMIISTILFGILGILEGRELSAILSGISGFILGKGLNIDSSRADDVNS